MIHNNCFPFDTLQILLNLFKDDDEIYNISIILGYVAQNITQYRGLKKIRKCFIKYQDTKGKKNNTLKIIEKIKQIMRLLSPSV